MHRVNPFFCMCFAVNDSLTSGNFEMADCVQNRPILHCIPLQIVLIQFDFTIWRLKIYVLQLSLPN